jgi:hypothetical protein
LACSLCARTLTFGAVNAFFASGTLGCLAKT